MIAAGTTSFRAKAATFESQPQQTHLLELFTSEGCSSCPPAEAWVSQLKDAPRLWHDFVPISFHVDYWDRLGWRDPFAAKQWTARQYAYSASWNSGSVYTPGFVLDGREWRNSGAPSIGSETPGVLKLETNGENASVSFQPTKKNAGEYEVHVARLGLGLKTNVRAGENSGRQLVHDFVVLSLTSAPLSGGHATVQLPKQEQPAGAIAAWVTPRSGLNPIQAVGGWLR